MTERFQKTVVEVVERILRAARADAQLLSGLRLCAEEILTLTTDAAPSGAEVPPALGNDPKPVVAPAPVTAASPPAVVPLSPVTPNHPTVQSWLANPRPAGFEVIGFMAPICVVRRKSDGRKGSVFFQHSPRFFFSFVPDGR